MAYDMTFKVGLEPEVDEKALYRSIMKVTGAIRKAKPGTSHANLSKQFGGLLQDLMATGQFATPSQAEQYVRRISGGKYTSEQMSIFTRGTSMVRASHRGFVPGLYPTFSERQMARWRPDLARVGGQYNNLLNAYATAKMSPTEENKSALIQAVKDIDASVNEIKKDRGKTLKTVDKIQKTSKDIGRDAANLPIRTPASTTSGLGALSFFGKSMMSALSRFFTGAAILGAVKKWVDFGISGTKEGSSDLAEQAMYGANRNIAIGRSRAKMYGLDESVTAAPERYAMDFRQRMMWGEVSDMEWVALSRMGSLGRKIISGEAAKDPAAFQRDIEEYIKANKGNEAEVRFMLSKLGWSPQIMKYGAIPYSQEETKRLEDAYSENIKAQKDAAIAVWKTADEFDKFIATLRADAANMLATLTGSEYVNRRLARAWGLSGYSSDDISKIYKEAMYYSQATEDAKKGWNWDLSRFNNPSYVRAWSRQLWDSAFTRKSAYDYYKEPTNVYNINTVNVQANDSEEFGKDLQKQVGSYYETTTR